MRPLVEARTSHQPHGVESEDEIHHLLKLTRNVTVNYCNHSIKLFEQLVSKKLYTGYHTLSSLQ